MLTVPKLFGVNVQFTPRPLPVTVAVNGCVCPGPRFTGDGVTVTVGDPAGFTVSTPEVTEPPL